MPTLLVVDDEPSVLYSMERSFQSDTLRVLTAQTGRRAIELVQSEHPDAIILDLRLTDMTGLEVFDSIRQIDSRLPVSGGRSNTCSSPWNSSSCARSSPGPSR